MTFSVRTGPDGFMEPTTSRRWVGSEGLGIPSPSWVPLQAVLFGVCVLPETYTLAPGSGCFSIVRYCWLDCGYST